MCAGRKGTEANSQEEACVLTNADWLHGSDRIFQNGKGRAALIALSDFSLSYASLREKQCSSLMVVVYILWGEG